MKFDKDFVMKNRFWMLLGVAMPMALVTVFLLFTAVTAGIDEKLNEIEKQYKDLEGALAGDLKNDQWIKVKKEEADKLKVQETEVWKKAYFDQDFLASWPKAFENKFHYSEGLFARAIEVLKKGDNEKEVPKGDTPADEVFTGILEKFDEDYIVVKGLNEDKEPESRTFQQTQDVKVTIEGNAKPFFRDLQEKTGSAVKVTYERSRYFDDLLTDNEILLYTSSYKDQIPPILESVNPVDLNGVGVVQLRGWPYVKGQIPPDGVPFLRFKPQPDFWDRNSLTMSSEAWTAQEDLWVQREIYRMVGQANDYVSKFQGTGGTALKKQYVFTNPNWKVEITWLGGKDIEFKVHNQLPRRQKVDVGFRIVTHKNLPGELITPGVEPLSAKGTPGMDFYHEKKHECVAVPQGIYGVEQVLNWETAAVKRIDLISIGAMDVSHSHRTLPRGYKPLKPVAVAATTEPGAEGAPSATAPGPGPPPGPPGPGGRPGFGEGGMQVTNVSKNGLMLDRYLDVTREARRIPVAVVLIIDQEHLDRVQTSFVNSKLRFLITQCLMSRYPQSLRPALNTDTLAGGSGVIPPGPGEGSRPPGPGFGSEGRGGFGRGGEEGGRGGFGFSPPSLGEGSQGGMTAGPTDGSTEESEANVELVIYGIVTLYQRYPPRVEAAAPATADATATATKEPPKDAPK